MKDNGIVKIGITGDTHGDVNLEKFNRAKKLRYSHVLVCGDFGYIFGGTNSEEQRLDRINELGLKIFFVDGNHENFDIMDQYPVSEWNGGKVQYIRPNIIHLMRGEIYDFFGNKVFCLGGAASTDKEWRMEDYDWWKEELPNHRERQYALENLERHGNEVDIVITHTVFSEALKALGAEYRADDFTEYLSIINKTIKYRKWYFGHMHIDKEVLSNVFCTYEAIRELKCR